MPLTLSISPHGKLFAEESSAAENPSPADSAAVVRSAGAFGESTARGLLHLAGVELQSQLPPAFSFARDFARDYLTRLSQLSAGEDAGEIPAVPTPPADVLGMQAMAAPPMKGLEYLTAGVLTGWWEELDALVRSEAGVFPGGAQAYLREKNPLWRIVGRVTFHLAENKRDAHRPFAFLATYATRLSAAAKVQHLPLRRALDEYRNDRPALVSLLKPIVQAAGRSQLARELAESNEVYSAQTWTPTQAYRFLQDIPAFEQSGLIVRVPDWWKASRPPRPVVSVKVGEAGKTKVGVEAMMDFSVGVTLEGEPLTEEEILEALKSAGGLMRLRGKWVEVDREKLQEALEHWRTVAGEAKRGEITFFEGMRLLAGAALPTDAAAAVPEAAREWTAIQPSEALEKTLSELRDPASLQNAKPPGLHAELRLYQQTGVNWLRFVTRLGLGACLADDMGLGKTIQVISLLLHMRAELENGAGNHVGQTFLSATPSPSNAPVIPSLLVVPASLIGNWKSELAKFAPGLSPIIIHPSEIDIDAKLSADVVAGKDVAITTYGMLARIAWMREFHWRLVILDEAQAIKNSGSRQTRTVKELKSAGRVALTGTPIENRLSDLWSLFDFLNPGLLGSAKAFSTFAKSMAGQEHNSYAPLRNLVRPYILRRLKTDKKIISDLPDKTEVNAYCGLSKKQALLYEQSIVNLAKDLKKSEGMQRRGIVLAYLMRLKQICNHPAQFSGDGDFAPAHSGKFQRMAELCEELAERQEKTLVFTQFREITTPLADHLEKVFGRPGLILHGGTSVDKRRKMVEQFQRDDGPPFFVLSLKAGGTGLNLTAASHVIHFDRWWNPAVENQATDRAFRIGQKRNVFVHKFVCRGTVEDKIDAMISQKSGLSKDLLDGGGETLLTEMSNEQLMSFVALDISKATT
ncbi:MAG TPA: DEAD/DEAH box helicase [Tepidisphaeraceae bacterium]|jgi:non-specific serine/threonine protein kinase|nr:DEAD/DEAH box helicase [Tepidisphaeraceae bacterium]